MVLTSGSPTEVEGEHLDGTASDSLETLYSPPSKEDGGREYNAAINGVDSHKTHTDKDHLSYLGAIP
jgi:hypothetical protein